MLLADDDADTRDALRIYLGMVGLDTETVPDGPTAVQMAKELLPDVIVLDVWMPGLDGYGAIRLLRYDAATASIPIILMTGAIGRTHLVEELGGADAAVSKPFAPSELLGVIRSLGGRA